MVRREHRRPPRRQRTTRRPRVSRSRTGLHRSGVSYVFSAKTITAWSKLSREGALLSVGSERPAPRNEHACGERGPLAGPRPAALFESCSPARQGHAEMEVRRANHSEVVELNPPRAGDVHHTFSRPLSFERGRPTLRVRVSASLVPESRGSVPGSHGCSSRSRAGDAGTVTGGVDVARPGRVRRLLQRATGVCKTVGGGLIWLILPVVICLSQRLSHACLSTYSCTVKPRMAH